MDDLNFVNNSGQGKGNEIPREVKRFNWGAFFFSWIWGLFNKSYLTLIALAVAVLSYVIAFLFGFIVGLYCSKEFAGMIVLVVLFLNFITGTIGLALSIWFGVKGNDWAWQNKKWDSLKHFHDVQRIWAIVGTILIGLGVVGVVAAMTLPVLLMNTNKVAGRAMILKSLSTVQQAAIINEAMDKKCEDLSSGGLAACMGQQLIGSADGAKFELSDGNILEFVGDGRCSDKNSCYVKIITTRAEEEKVGLYLDQKRYLKINMDDVEKISDKYKSKNK